MQCFPRILLRGEVRERFRKEVTYAVLTTYCISYPAYPPARNTFGRREMRKIAMALVLAVSLLGFGAVAAQAWVVTNLYVSPSGTSGAADTSCSTAGDSNITAAITAASSGGTVVVCKGTYHTQAIVSKPLNLIGKSGA